MAIYSSLTLSSESFSKLTTTRKVLLKQLHPIFETSVADWLCLPELAFAVFGRSNKALALKVLSKRGEGIWEASTSLKDDPEVILTAMKTYPAAFANASYRLRDDIDFVIEALSIAPGIARLASERLQAVMVNVDCAHATPITHSISDIAEEFIGGRNGPITDGFSNNFRTGTTQVYIGNEYKGEVPTFFNDAHYAFAAHGIAIGINGFCAPKSITYDVYVNALKEHRSKQNHLKAQDNLAKLKPYCDGFKCSYILDTFQVNSELNKRELAVFTVSSNSTNDVIHFLLGSTNEFDEQLFVKHIIKNLHDNFLIDVWSFEHGLNLRFESDWSTYKEAKHQNPLEVALLENTVELIETRNQKEWLAKQIPAAKPTKTIRSNKI